MKLVVLVDSSKRSFDEFVKIIGEKASVIDTGCDNGGVSEEDESNYIESMIDDFSEDSRHSVLAVRFSGKEEVIREVGDLSQEMVIPLSSKGDAPYCQLNYFIENNLLNIF